jgi:hypothetical protein
VQRGGGESKDGVRVRVCMRVRVRAGLQRSACAADEQNRDAMRCDARACGHRAELRAYRAAARGRPAWRARSASHLVDSRRAPSAKKQTASATRGGAPSGCPGELCSVQPACHVASPSASGGAYASMA